MDLTRRIDRPELMDTQTFPVEVMRETLSFLGVTNRYFGGAEVVVSKLKQWSLRWPVGGAVRILDVGTGGAEIPVAIARWARSAGREVEVTAVDLVPQVAAIAHVNARAYPEIFIDCLDAFDLARRGETFDYVTASLLLHHIAPSDSVRLLKCFDGMASRGVIISDLLRSRSGYWAVSALSRLIGNAVVRHDGPLSVRRAFQLSELKNLAEEAALPYLVARNEPWFRVSLAGEK